MGKNSLSKGSPAGGFGSAQHRKVGVRTGSGSIGTSPRGVSQIGSSMENHATGVGKVLRGAVENLHQGPSFQPVAFGNSVALNVGKGSPGAGRNLYGQSGSQGCYGAPAQGVNVGSGPSTRTGRDLTK